MKNFIKYISFIFLMNILTFEIKANESEFSAVYYFAMHPGYGELTDTLAIASIYSTIESEIGVYQGNNKIRNGIKTIKNGFKNISFSGKEVKAFPSYDEDLREKVYENAAIKIMVNGSNDNSCIIKTLYRNNSDRMMLIEKSKLGYEYFVSNQAKNDSGNGKIINFVTIVGIYDNTRLTFRMGGSDNCNAILEDGRLLKINQTIRRTINEGDVWLIPAAKNSSVLTGSGIFANKPVAVFSGSSEAYSIQNGTKNYTITQEIPVSIYGKSFLVPKLLNNYPAPQLQIFSNIPYNSIYINGIHAAFIKSPGGKKNEGFIETDVNFMKKEGFTPTQNIKTESSANCIISDPQIIYNKVKAKPFILPVLATENFSKSAIFEIENIEEDFINIVYQVSDDGVMPSDMKISYIENNTEKTVELSTFSSKSYEFYFFENLNITKFRAKNIIFDKPGVYKINANNPFAVYQYGFGEETGYGFVVNGDYTIKNTVDTLAPKFEYSSCCLCEINGKVTDLPDIDPENRSGLAAVYLDQTDSYNFRFNVTPFIIGSSASTTWELDVRDASLDARAHLVTYDYAGNRSDTIIACGAWAPIISPSLVDLGELEYKGKTITKKIDLNLKMLSNIPINPNLKLYLILDSDSTESKEMDINTNQNFTITKYKNFNLYSILKDTNQISLEVVFSCNEEGEFKDSLGFIIVSKVDNQILHWEYITELKAKVGSRYIFADDYNFDTVYTNDSNIIKLKLNTSDGTNMSSTLDLKITGITFNNNDIGFMGSGKAFEVDLPNNITPENPMILNPGEFLEFDVKFHPNEERNYQSEIEFESETLTPDNITILKGLGLNPTSIRKDIELSEIQIISVNNFIKFSAENNYILEKIEIYDLSGMNVLTKLTESELNNTSIDVKNLSKGVYFVKLFYDGKILIKKVII